MTSRAHPDPEEAAAAPRRSRRRSTAAGGLDRRRRDAQAEGNETYRLRRNEVIDVAAQAFREHGFDGVSLSAIAERLGTDRTSLYYYVGSKRELFQGVAEDVVQRNVDETVRIRDSSGSAVERLERIVRSTLSCYAEHYPYMFVFIQEDLARIAGDSSRWGRRVRGLHEAYHGAIRSVLLEGLHAGTFSFTGPVDVVTSGIIGMLNWTHRWWQPGRPGVEQLADGFVALLIDGLTSA